MVRSLPGESKPANFLGGAINEIGLISLCAQRQLQERDAPAASTGLFPSACSAVSAFETGALRPPIAERLARGQSEGRAEFDSCARLMERGTRTDSNVNCYGCDNRSGVYKKCIVLMRVVLAQTAEVRVNICAKGCL